MIQDIKDNECQTMLHVHSTFRIDLLQVSLSVSTSLCERAEPFASESSSSHQVRRGVAGTTALWSRIITLSSVGFVGCRQL